MILGYSVLGSGKSKVIVTHDWLSDCSGYDSLLRYLDLNYFTFVFADLRGYGKSKKLGGVCTVEEASKDIYDLADSLKFEQFHFIGHSMSGMIGQYMATMHPERLKSLSLITPISASGSPIPDVMMAFVQDATRSNDFLAEQMVNFMSGSRLTPQFLKLKVKDWRETSELEARLAYLAMFSETDFSNRMRGITTPILILLGTHDAESNSREVMEKTILTWCPQAETVVIENAGHYPTQETPVYLATLIEAFQKKHS